MTTPTTPTCYRHPDRETRLSCSECGRPICTECSIDTPVGQKCPDDAAPTGRHRVVTAREIRTPSRRATAVTFALIGVNLVLYLIGRAGPDLSDRLFLEGAQIPVLVDAGEWWRGITAMFLHADIAHVAFNMWALYLFGPALERRFGSVSFASLYLASGLGGSALYHLLGRQAAAIGASGAIFGLMGALIVTLYPHRHTRMGRAIFPQLMLLLAINLALPAVIPNIAWEAHLGGLVAGGLVAAAWDRIPVSGRAAIPRRVSVALVVVVIAICALLFG